MHKVKLSTVTKHVHQTWTRRKILHMCYRISGIPRIIITSIDVSTGFFPLHEFFHMSVSSRRTWT